MALDHTTLPKTLIQAVKYFADPETCHEFMTALRWPDGIKCAHCDSDKVGKLVVTRTKSGTERRLWNCKACKKQFTAKVGTIFEDSALPLEKWLLAVWLICNAKNGVSSCELARTLGVTQKTAWFMGHRIRTAMHDGVFNLAGEVEADEAFIGGKVKYMHANRRAAFHRGEIKKEIVFGMLERSPEPGKSRVFVEHVRNRRRDELESFVKKNVVPGSALYTDSLKSYNKLSQVYKHEWVDHEAKVYVKGRVSTNGMENFWSNMKRSIKGSYVCVSPDHLFRYCDESATRFNERSETDTDRFMNTMKRTEGRRLDYRGLTGRVWHKGGF